MHVRLVAHLCVQGLIQVKSDALLQAFRQLLGALRGLP